MTKQKPNIQDITSLHQKFELLMRNTEEPFVLIDTNYIIITFNEQFRSQYLKFFGKEFLKGDNILNYAQAHRVDLLKKMYLDVFNGQTFQSEIEIPFPDNTKRVFLNKYKPALNEEGKTVGAFISSSDITDRLISERLQKKTEKRFQALIENANEIISLTDKAGNIFYISPSATKITGYTLEELSNGGHFKSIDPTYKENAEILLQQSLSSPGVPQYRLYNVTHKNGSTIWMEGTVTNLLHDENVRAVVSNFRNVTEKKVAEEKLKESENNLKTIFNNSNEAFMLLDTEFNIKAFNAKATENYPYTQRALQIGENLVDYVQEERQKYFTEYLNRVLKGEIIDYDTCYSKDGKDHWFHATLSPVKEGPSITGICFAIRDITEKKLTEESIRIAKERYDIVAKATNDAIYDWNLQTGELIRTGDGLKILFGYELEEATETDFWRKRIHPEDIDKATRKLDLLLSQPDKFYCNQEYRFLKADGTYAYVFDKGFIIRNSSGKAIRMIGATQDITHRKETELLLKSLNENLEERAKELADSNNELEQFAYTASHDLQEPLRMITSFLKQLELKYKDQLDDKAQQYIYFATDGAARLRRIILDLLEYSLAGKKTIEVEVVDTEMVLVESMQLLRKTIEEKNAVIKYGHMPTLTANKSSLLQVFQNLIGNGLKYQKKGHNPTIQINAIETNTHWQFSFCDNGIGVEPQFFEKIFVAFQRLHNRSEYDGTGLGLAICKKIIENHSGKIWLESNPGEGSTFYFTIIK